MSIRVALNHQTRYRYDRPITLSPHVFRLRPAPHCRTPIEAYALKISPSKHFINWQQDSFGNYLARVVFPEKVQELAIEVDLVAEMVVINPFDFFLEEDALKYPFEYHQNLRRELAPYLEVTENGPLLMQWLSRVDRSPKNTVDFLVELNQGLCQDVKYAIRMEPGVQTCEQTLGRAIGSCRDSAWLLVQILRHLKLAARFVSGYLVQLKPDQKSLDGPSGTEIDFTDLHAWAEVYVPGAGWLGLDPTSGLFAGEGHIPLACTPEPASAAPVTGVAEKAKCEFFFENNIQRIHEDPRVTKPYTEEQWLAVNALAAKVDELLQQGDVRLSMGGEPTFVSIDDMEAPEWNTEADGQHKRRLAADLIKRLRHAFGPDGMLHFGQGKWYPGEPLPRWQLACFWRKDGQALWHNEGLLAEEGQNYGHDIALAERFLQHLAGRLGVDTNHILPAYEDTLYYLWQEGRQPINIDLLQADLKAPLERRRLREVLQQGLGKPTGYVLPLRRNEGRDVWQSSPWEFRRGRLFLTPGNSPLGLRLPLESLPWVAPERRPPASERSLFDPLPPLPTAIREARLRQESAAVPETAAAEYDAKASQRKEEAKWIDIAHTALCVEPRNGRLHIFMPPLAYLEHYLELVEAVEASAQVLQTPVVLEGYEPPKDPRLQRLLVTPDPGVIEVNIHPAENWEQLVHNTETLYEQARLARLGTEKFMLDGRHTGTGGGNHVTLGGPTPADSPMLRRPELLRSLITYWQHHPGLSYLFASQFIGPTSQAPRVDEGRTEQLYELEIAFDQMDGRVNPPLWLVDRLLRNLLVDVTGNTHRAEFCIDKLYSPDSLSRQLGLVEFRAFDMPPHARMSLVQMLLIRTLLVWFWNYPYRHRLVRWGTELHDRFMLPHYVETDLADVVADLHRAGLPFAVEWLAPFFEFRFPHYGSVTMRDIQLELRMAIEPWHVMGEEVTRRGTARFVDSSLERLQVKVKGLTDSRHVVACNGRRLPLNNTGTHGEYVCGVRYRAWQPPSALHPTIGVHSPLVFDIIDCWNGRSIGGCTYHVMHPGGRHYETIPVNAFEAEARRNTRFWNYGHTPGTLQPPPVMTSGGRFVPEGSGPPGPMSPPSAALNLEYPYTLDLRRGAKAR